jgi:hypothetical protein
MKELSHQGTAAELDAPLPSILDKATKVELYGQGIDCALNQGVSICRPLI